MEDKSGMALKRVKAKAGRKPQKKKNPPAKKPYLTYLRLKFELLKRNEEYRRDYLQKLPADLYRKWGIARDPDKKFGIIPLPTDTVEEEQALSKKFFDDLLSITLVKDGSKLSRINVSINAEAPWQLVEDALKGFLTSDDLVGDRKLTPKQQSEIDNAYASGDDIEAEQLEEKYYRRQQLPKKKLDPDKIELALIIYDLKMNQKMTSENIAKKLFPNETSDETDKGNDSPVRKVNRYLRMARRMIKTGKLW